MQFTEHEANVLSKFLEKWIILEDGLSYEDTHTLIAILKKFSPSVRERKRLRDHLDQAQSRKNQRGSAA